MLTRHAVIGCDFPSFLLFPFFLCSHCFFHHASILPKNIKRTFFPSSAKKFNTSIQFACIFIVLDSQFEYFNTDDLKLDPSVKLQKTTMQAFFFLLLALLTLLPTPLAFPLSVPNLFRRACDATCLATTDNLLLHTPMPAFQTARNAKNPAYLDWTSDGCTDSPDKPLGYNFLPSCQRHDFGYRNYKAQGRFTEPNRKIIDDNLKADLYNECSKYKGLQALKGVECRGLADVYYDAVREFGDES